MDQPSYASSSRNSMNDNERIEQLRAATEELKGLELQVKERVEQAKITNEEMNEQDINQWLKEAEEVRSNAESIWLTEKKAEPNWLHRLTRGGRQPKKCGADVLKMKDVIRGLVAQGKSTLSVCFRTDPLEIANVLRDKCVRFESRESGFNKIMKGLKDWNISIIGVWGMGGIGKTNLVGEIGKKSKREKLFDKVVFAPLSQTPNYRNIQGMLADMLSLQLKESDEVGRAKELRAKILEAEKILIILDDVWEKINLDEIGIPSPADHRGCKIVLTTRSSEVCRNMNSELDVHLDQLEEAETWKLFGMCADLPLRDENLRFLAEKIVKECCGLPLAIVTVGSSLKHRKRVEDYKDALKKLKSFSFEGMESADDQSRDLYSCLKLSYDYLEDDDSKKCFLLCSLNPEDSEIKEEELTRTAFGLWMFDKVDSVDEARNRISSSVNKLVNACLLSSQERFGEKYYKMHDVVRDVALWITQKVNGAPFLVPTSVQNFHRLQRTYNKNATALYLSFDFVDSCKLDFSRLKVLIIEGETFEDAEYPDNIFDKVNALQVLEVRDTSYISQSSSLQNLNNLRALILNGYHYVSDLFIIGKLKNLEILELKVKRQGNAGELPEEIGELCNLRLLDVSGWDTSLINNSLTRLSKIEELYIERNNGDTVDLSQLECLHRLTVLTGSFGSVKDFPCKFRFPKLRMYHIHCGGHLDKIKFSRGSKTLELDDLADSSMKAFEKLLPDVEDLRICGPMEGLGNMIPQIDDMGFQSLRELRLDSSRMQCLIDTTGLPRPPQKSLKYLVKLHLIQMNDFVRICNGPTPINFANLKEVTISACPKLENIVPNVFTVGPVLDKLDVSLCHNLKSVYELQSEAYLHTKDDLLMLPCPTSMTLSGLQKLESIWRGHHEREKSEVNDNHNDVELHTMILEATLKSLKSLIEINISSCAEVEEVFPVLEPYNCHEGQLVELELEKLCLVDLPKLKCIWKSPPQNCVLHKLTHIRLERCAMLRSLFTSKLAQLFLNLRYLEISECESLEIIIAPDQHGELSSTLGTCFQEIREIKIESCGKLKKIVPLSLSGGGFSKLETLSIKNCAELEQVFYDGGEENVTQVRDINMVNLKLLTLGNLPSLIELSPSYISLRFPSPSGSMVGTRSPCFKCASCCLIPRQEKWEVNDNHNDVELRTMTLEATLKRLKSLVKINIFSCAKIEEVFPVLASYNSYEGQLVVLELKDLYLVNLPKLKCIWKSPPQNCVLHKLTHITLGRCAMLRRLFTSKLAQLFLNLRYLEISECESLEIIIAPDQHGELSSTLGTCFQEIREIKIEYCGKLKKIVPLSLSGGGFSKLETLSIEYCAELEQVFYDGGEENVTQVRDIKMVNLKHLTLKNLPSLIELSPSYISLRFPSLSELMIGTGSPSFECASGSLIPRQSRICNTYNEIFPLTSFDVRSISIGNCYAEEVFDLKADGDGQSAKSLFCNLVKLQLSCLPSLKCLWKGCTKFISLRSLHRISMNNCGSLKSLFTGSMARTLESLEIMEVFDCMELESIFEPHMEADYSGFSSSCTFLPELSKIKIRGCNKLKFIFPLSIAQRLLKLEEIYIDEASQLEQLFFEDRNGYVEDKEIMLPVLGRICLERLPRLSSIWPPDYSLRYHYHFKLFGLKILTVDTSADLIRQLTEFKRLHWVSLRCSPTLRSNLSQIHCLKLDQSRTASRCLFTRDIFGSLWSLTVIEVMTFEELENIFEPRNTKFVELESMFEPRDTAQSSTGSPECRLTELQRINVGGCDKLKSLFFFPISESLLKLEEICIKGASQLEQLFMEDENGYVGSKMVKLSKLKLIRLKGCDQLRTIFPLSVATGLSNLRALFVEGCNSLRTIFPLSAARWLPELQEVYIKGALQLEKIFSEDREYIRKDSIMLSKLDLLRLEELPSLIRIFPAGYNLIFPPSAMLILKKCSVKEPGHLMELLDVKNCRIDVLFELKEPVCKVLQPVPIYLRCLRLARMRNLSYIWKGPCELINLSLLQVIKLEHCRPKLMKSLFTYTTARTLLSLEAIRIIGWKELENLIEPALLENNCPAPCFPRLKNLFLSGCDGLKTVFPLSIAQCLPELTSVYIKGAHQLKEVFTEDRKEEMALYSKWIILPELLNLHLEQLPRLSGLCPPGYALSCQYASIIRLQISECPLMDKSTCFAEHSVGIFQLGSRPSKQLNMRKGKRKSRRVRCSSASLSLQLSDPSKALKFSNYEKVFKEGTAHLEQSFRENLAISLPSQLPAMVTEASLTTSQISVPSYHLPGSTYEPGSTSSGSRPPASSSVLCTFDMGSLYGNLPPLHVHSMPSTSSLHGTALYPSRCLPDVELTLSVPASVVDNPWDIDDHLVGSSSRILPITPSQGEDSIGDRIEK